jgi:hypothetical protein
VVARFAKFESLQKAIMTILRTKPRIRVEPVAVGVSCGSALAILDACSLMCTHESKFLIVQMGESQASMTAQPVDQVLRFCGQYSDRRLFER